uniref:Serine/threonine-protein phosphatase n=1 Tax=Timema poppense TaxID=170557 RepID=A0A7R9GV78_TIMPO|nr:unnamed protein product [Timema poppensis]
MEEKWKTTLSTPYWNFNPDLPITGDIPYYESDALYNAATEADVNLAEWQIRQLCLVTREIFLEQPMLLELEAPVNIVGDIHGQYEDLLRHFDKLGYPPDANYLFLGDYVDRGKNSLETICLLLAYKIKYPNNFFLLRGNHECASINRVYGFYDECKRRYSVKLWKTFTDLFNCLPVAALIEGTIFCMHGGLSPQLGELNDIRSIPRPIDVPDSGLVCDLLWGDPAETTQQNMWNFVIFHGGSGSLKCVTLVWAC